MSATDAERARRGRRRAWITRAVIVGIVLAILAFWSWMVPGGAGRLARDAAAEGAQLAASEALERLAGLVLKVAGAGAVAFVGALLARR